MHIAIVGDGINGLCCARELARQGHNVELFERGSPMHETSREYAIEHTGKDVAVLGGKWTTAPALADKLVKNLV